MTAAHAGTSARSLPTTPEQLGLRLDDLFKMAFGYDVHRVGMKVLFLYFSKRATVATRLCFSSPSESLSDCLNFQLHAGRNDLN